ncbi:TetR/AcrR family transcriptional regulator [Streptomyces iconiensis]|uniref:TetR/AcrR family transcriptional regulator n=1 Tax=Streptomyces iconiensis TaxID=1384038 RepID=A0ABT6ZZR3_9ACTN|nr:TetR/AcrR family transcriptional regulator [Streptomyces iconiensis]MDJ1133888.1 TetR/AcrR family transcriptional regulator [Streptomyces iconiensis]
MTTRVQAQVTSRRDRLREATLAEIHEAARGLLTSRGSDAVTMNAVAREVGMSGPALYHYFKGHEELVGAVTARFFRELTGEMEAARDAHAEDSLDIRLLATCRAMRAWATAHPAEFGWIFARPIPSVHHEPGSARLVAGERFETVLRDQVMELWETRPFPVPDLTELAPSLREQLHAYAESVGGRLPPEAAHVFLTCWSRLYGLLCMEVLRQLDSVYSDMEPVYEECLRELAGLLGLEYDGGGR